MQEFIIPSVVDVKHSAPLSWPECVLWLEDLFSHVPSDHLWFQDVGLVFSTVKGAFETDYSRMAQVLDVVLGSGQDMALNTLKTEDALVSWQDGKQPSMTSLLFYALEKTGFSAQDKELVLPCLAAGVLADAENDLPYHNNFHYFKVALHSLRLMMVHNMIFDGTPNVLGQPDISMILSAAAIHDLGHTGGSNIIDRKYHSAKLELKSFDYASPYLKSAGFTEDMLSDIKTMLYTTDASPFGDPISPSNQLRAAYEYHYGSAEPDDDILQYLSDDLKVLEDRPKLCMMAMILHEADLMNSCGVSYDMTKRESIMIGREMGKQNAFPEDTLLFLQKICGGGMVSDSAQTLAGESFSRIYDQVCKDCQNGNLPYDSAGGSQ